MIVGSFPRPSSLITSGGNDWKSDRVKKVCFPVKLSRFGAWNSPDRCLLVRSQHHLLKPPIKGFEERTTFNKRHNRKFLVNAASGQSLESEPGAYKPKSVWDSFKNASDAFYRFSRPHTVIGTVLSIVSVSLLAVEKLSDISPLFFTGVLEAVLLHSL